MASRGQPGGTATLTSAVEVGSVPDQGDEPRGLETAQAVGQRQGAQGETEVLHQHVDHDDRCVVGWCRKGGPPVDGRCCAHRIERRSVRGQVGGGGSCASHAGLILEGGRVGGARGHRRPAVARVRRPGADRALASARRAAGSSTRRRSASTPASRACGSSRRAASRPTGTATLLGRHGVVAHGLVVGDTDQGRGDPQAEELPDRRAGRRDGQVAGDGERGEVLDGRDDLDRLSRPGLERTQPLGDLGPRRDGDDVHRAAPSRGGGARRPAPRHTGRCHRRP